MRFAMAITYKVAKEPDTHTRKEELPKEDERMSYMTRQRHKLETHRCDESNASESTAELHAGGDVLRAGSTHWELFVSLFHPLWDYQCFGWCVGFVFFCFVGRFCWWCCFVGWLVFPCFAFRMHKVVIHSKTVTIVMMSAALEQKKVNWWRSGLLKFSPSLYRVLKDWLRKAMPHCWCRSAGYRQSTRSCSMRPVCSGQCGSKNENNCPIGLWKWCAFPMMEARGFFQTVWKCSIWSFIAFHSEPSIQKVLLTCKFQFGVCMFWVCAEQLLFVRGSWLFSGQSSSGTASPVLLLGFGQKNSKRSLLHPLLHLSYLSNLPFSNICECSYHTFALLMPFKKCLSALHVTFCLLFRNVWAGSLYSIGNHLHIHYPLHKCNPLHSGPSILERLERSLFFYSLSFSQSLSSSPVLVYLGLLQEESKVIHVRSSERRTTSL